MLTAAGTDVVTLGCVHTESRLAENCVRVCVCVMTVGFLCWQVQSLVAHVAAERAAGAASDSLRIQWERWTGKQKQRENS